jgi:hypothetical protein
MTGTTVEANFTAYGTYDLNKSEQDDMTPEQRKKWYKDATILVSVTNGASSQLNIPASTDGNDNWSATTAIGPGDDYTLTAVLNQGTAGEASDTCDDISVVMAAMTDVTIDWSPDPAQQPGGDDYSGDISTRLGGVAGVKQPTAECTLHKVAKKVDAAKKARTYSHPGKQKKKVPATVMVHPTKKDYWQWKATLHVPPSHVLVVTVFQGQDVVGSNTSPVKR